MSKNDSEDRKNLKKELTSAIRQDKRERRAISAELNVKGPLTVPQLADATGIPAHRVLQHILVMMKSGQVVEAGEKDGGYAYNVKR